MTAAITVDQLRHLQLRAQGLGGTTAQPPGQTERQRVLSAIERMAALQIDTIHVAAKSPYLVLWSRVGDYKHSSLDELLAAGDIFEYWAHAACFLPARDIEAYRAFGKARVSTHQRYTARWLEGHGDVAERVRDRIAREGPLRSADFERSDGRKGNGWWDWKEEKMALEALFDAGVLMVRERRAFQRVYDLAERVRPHASEPMPLEQARRQLVLRAAGALGVARPEWIANYLFLNQPKTPVVKLIREMAKAGELHEMSVTGWAEPAFALPGWIDENDPATATEGGTALLSPFDPVVWDRDRLAELFGFDYRIECYTPEPKRKYGYFSLPILHNGAMVGRLDPKAHRKDGVLEIKSLHLEPGVVPDADLVDGLKGVLTRFAAWHKTPEVVVTTSNPRSLKRALRIR
jgi:uncharacterized protein